MPLYPSTRIVLIGLAAAASLSLGGCAVNGRPYVSAGYVYGGPAGVAYFDYWYYPGVRVYYDIHRHVYFYPSNGSWVQVRVLPPALRARLGRHVVVKSRYQRPYREYNEHHRRYPEYYYQPPQKKQPEQYRYVPRRDNRREPQDYRYQPPQKTQPEQYRYVPQRDNQGSRQHEQRREEHNTQRNYQRDRQNYLYQPPAKKAAPAKDNRRSHDKGKSDKGDKNKNQKQRDDRRPDGRRDRGDRNDQYDRDRRDYRQ
ncbi:MAG: hypothetical protein P8Z75_06145 [Gammaproteobacteria bacterium]|jgi:hypothetical protein